MKSIYEIPLASAEGTPNHLEQYKGKVTLVVNTTVGCGNANQLEVLQWLQEKYSNEDFEIIAVPTNDYCGPGVTKGKWSEGITCGLDSKNYGEDVYGTTFKYSEMVSSIPHEKFYEMYPHFHADRIKQPPHELYADGDGALQKKIGSMELDESQNKTVSSTTSFFASTPSIQSQQVSAPTRTRENRAMKEPKSINK